MRNGRTRIIGWSAAAAVVVLAGAAVPPGAAWGNGCAACVPGYPSYGPHDAIANATLAWLRVVRPSAAAWIDPWFIPFGGDFGPSYHQFQTAPGPTDNWLAYTDDPDSTFQDFENHLYMVHPRPGADERGAPPRVAALYELLVENLTTAKLLGPRVGVLQTHNAAYLAGLMTHYVGDLSQYGHTDDTRRDHSHPAVDPQDRTFHGYYESVAWTATGYAALDAALRAPPAALAPVEDVARDVETLARWTNARDGGAVQYRDSNGATVTVGTDYAMLLDRYVAQYDANVRFNGMRGYDAFLWQRSVENMRGSVELLARIFAQADRDGDLVGSLVPVPA